MPRGQGAALHVQIRYKALVSIATIHPNIFQYETFRPYPGMLFSITQYCSVVLIDTISTVTLLMVTSIRPTRYLGRCTPVAFFPSSQLSRMKFRATNLALLIV